MTSLVPRPGRLKIRPGTHCLRMRVIPIKPGNLCISSDVNRIIFLRFTEYCECANSVYQAVFSDSLGTKLINDLRTFSLQNDTYIQTMRTLREALRELSLTIAAAKGIVSAKSRSLLAENSGHILSILQ